MNRRSLSFLLIVLGGLLLLAAALVSNAVYQQSLLTDQSRSLSWGPTLFRLLLAVHGLALIVAGMVWRRKVQSPGFSRNAGNEVNRLKPELKTLAVLAVLTLVALVLRLFRLNTDLWFDEVLMVIDLIRLPFGDMVTSFTSQNQHLLYTILAHTSARWFGESAWAVRLPSVMFGVGSIWALFLLGRNIIGTRVALLSCALITLSYHHIWFSQNARGYMGLMFFSTLTTWLWLEAWRRDGFGWWLAYATVAALGAWVQMLMVFVVAAHGLLYLVWLAWPKLSQRDGEKRNLIGKRRWYPIMAWALCGTLTLQVYALALPEFLHTGLHEVSEPSEWISLWWLVKESLRSLQLGFSALIVLLAGGALVGVGFFSLLKRDALATLSMILPPVFVGVTTLLWSHNFWPRLFFFAMGFALLIVMHGALTLPHWLRSLIPALPIRERWANAAGVAIAALMILASSLTVPRVYALPKQDYSGARDFVERNRRSNDAVVAVGLAGVAYSKYFAPQWAAAQTQVELNNARQGHSDVWLVYTIPIQVKAYRPDVWKVIEREFEVVKVFPGTLGGGEVFVCRQRNKNVIADGKKSK